MSETEITSWKQRFPEAEKKITSAGHYIYIDKNLSKILNPNARPVRSEMRWAELGFKVRPGRRESAVGFSSYKGFSALYPQHAMERMERMHFNPDVMKKALREIAQKTGRSSASAPAPKVTLSEQEALDYLLGKPAEVFGPAWTLTECEPPDGFGRSMYARPR